MDTNFTFLYVYCHEHSLWRMKIMNKTEILLPSTNPVFVFEWINFAISTNLAISLDAASMERHPTFNTTKIIDGIYGTHF